MIPVMRLLGRHWKSMSVTSVGMFVEGPLGLALEVLYQD
jgi:hypothetical protein